MKCLTAMNPDWRPEEYHKQWLLGVVYLLAKSKYRDGRGKYSIEKLNCLNTISHLDNLHNMNSLHQSLIYSLYFRNSYGGMKGDQHMIHYFIEKWYHRFCDKSNNQLFKLLLYYENFKKSQVGN